jgi:subtilisin family serine protease
MKKKIFPTFALFLLILVFAQPVTAETTDNFAPNEIIVKFRENTANRIEKELDHSNGILNFSPHLSAQLDSKYRIRQIKPLVKDFRAKHQQLQSLRQKKNAILTQKDKHLLKRFQRMPAQRTVPNLERIYKIKLDCPSDQSLQEALEAYRNNPEVEYAELNYKASIESAPNDPLYHEQWSLSKINAPDAWDIYTGNSKIIVALLDTGVDYHHRDIATNMWINDDEYEGIEGVDDDNNGYIDDLYGYNFIYNNEDPFDDHGHGTHCAGIIAAEGNNGLDISGVCWNARIMALKAFNYDAGGYTYDLVEAIIYAVTNGADIISNSWTIDDVPNELQSIKEAFDYAYSQGVISVAAAGNQNSNEPRYPAFYQHVISVAATDPQDNRWIDDNTGQGSNFGDWVDIAAPGVSILSLRAINTGEGVVYNQYTTRLTGTSMACPHVAGACALLLSANPTMKYREVYNKLIETIDPISPGICSSNGRINLSKVMQAVVPSQGYVNFDQDYYTYTSKVGLLLADRDLRGKGSQVVTITTQQGDIENITLSETDLDFGVFTGKISISSAVPNINDGILQASSGEIITASYFDPDEGSGNPTSTDIAFIDYEMPVLVNIQIEALARQATITFTTNEPTRATIRYGLTPDEQFTLSKEDLAVTTSHTFKLQPLNPETDYYFVIDLVDVAGNEITIVNNGQYYSLFTSSDTIGIRVPEAYLTIQKAINHASDGDTIWVADGRYTGTENKNIDFKGKAITVKSENGPENCIIDCQNQGFGFYFHMGEGPNSVLNGFTIINGSVSGRGGGIYCDGSSPTIIDCIISRNRAGKYGGGMYNFNNSNPKIIDCAFVQNSAGINFSDSGNGGGICNLVNSNPTLTNCTFIENSATYQGAGMYNEEGSSPILVKCIFIENSSKNGGGIYNFSNSNPALTNCIFVDNSAEFGGAIQNASSTNLEPSITTLNNCTLFRNEAEKMGGGIMNSSGGASILNNCIIWDNNDLNGKSESAQIDNTTGSQITAVNYSCIQGWTGNIQGIGNIDSDPLFFDTEKDDYHLKSTGWRWDRLRQRWHYDDKTSPCVDAGNPGAPLKEELLAIPDDPTNNWGINLRINMGAYGGTAEASMAPHNWTLLGDLNNDGNVNLKDYAAQIQTWSGTESELPGDLNRDGAVNRADLNKLAAEWLQYIKPPFVNITYPADGEVFDGALAEVRIEIDTWDTNGSIVKVEFFADGIKIGEDNDGSDGWSFNWIEHSLGEYYLTARAIDNGGAITTSNQILIWIIPLRD